MISKYFNLGKKLFPICRSLTGEGTRKTLNIIKKEFPSLKIQKIRCGSKVYDWNVPPEWNIKKAYVIDKTGKKIIDFKNNNLHIIGYSVPVNTKISKETLLKNLHSLPKQPKAIPYKTSYYKRFWGFCVTHNQKKNIIKNYKSSDKFKVLIDSNLNDKGNLRYGELVLKGKSKQEILISTNICHPSMANNELSGPIVIMSLIKYFKKYKKLEKTIRFIFIPETIGSIAYINKNLEKLKKYVIGGYHLTCIGDNRSHGCKLSKYGNSLVDKSLLEAYKLLKIKFKRYSYLNPGSDERQFSSPGINLPMASIFRTKYLEYPEYHTSLDDFKIVSVKGLKGGFKVSRKAIEILQKKIIPKSLVSCQPLMSKRGLYPTLSNLKNIIPYKKSKNFLDFLQYSDGSNDLIEMSKILKLKFKKVLEIYNLLLRIKLISN